MIHWPKQQLYNLLRWSQRYTKMDMVYMTMGNFWLTVPRFILLFAGMGLTVAFANLLTPETFGTYKYVLAAAGLIGAFSLNGMGSSVLRSVAKGNPHVLPELVRTHMLWSVPASIVAAGISAYYFYNDNSTLGYALLFIAVSNVFINGFGLAKSALIATGDFKANTLSGFPRALLSIAIVLGTVLLTKDVVWILLAYFGSNLLLSWSLYRYSIRHQHIDGRKASKEQIREALSLGKHMSVLGFLLLISGQLDQLLLWHFAAPTTLAIYALALTPAKEARGLLTNFITVAFPRLAKKTRIELDQILPRRLWQMAAVACILFITYILCVPVLFELFFPKYLSSIPVAQALGLLILIQPLSIFDSLTLTHGNVRKRYFVVIGSQIFDLILLCTLIPFFGLWGAVAATILSEFIINVSFFIAYRSERKLA